MAGFNPGTGLKDTVQAQPSKLLLLLLVACALAPSRFAMPALVLRTVTNAAKGPWMGNSQLWATMMDCVILSAMLSRGRLLRRLSAQEERSVVSEVGMTIRWQLAIFYFASGFWKANTSFCDARYSCASIFCVQLLEYFPDSILFGGFKVVDSMAQLIAYAAPWLTLLGEMALSVLHALDPHRYPRCARLGVLCTVAFHMIIGLTPPPSNVSSFGVTTCTRLFFYLPAEITHLIEHPTPILICLAATGPAVALLIVDTLHREAISTIQGSGRDLHLAYYAVLAVLLCRAAAMPPCFKEPAKSNKFHVGAALMYALALPVFGLQEKGGALMFSQLRMHGGSNHYFLPTALMQRWLVDAHPTNAFAGGVVRITQANLSWVGNSFAEHMGPRTLRLVREVAKVPAEYVWASKSSTRPRVQPAPRFREHTLSNLGLRRLLETAKRQREALTLTYHRLHGAEGDESWRTKSPGKIFMLEIDADGRILRCHQLLNYSTEQRSAKCDRRELSLVAPPTHHLSVAATVLLLPQVNPVIPGYSEEMHCVTWG